MTQEKINRRRLLQAAVGGTVAVSAATLAGSTPALAGSPAHGPVHGPAKGRLLPKNKLGIQLFSIRDKVSQLGFRAVFEELSRIGFREVEFAGYTQSTSILGRQITVPEIRQLLDDNGLVGAGSHVGLGNFTNPSQREIEFENAQILGLSYVGTANAPTGDNTVAGYKAAAEVFNEIGAAAARRRLKFYQHNHAGEFAFATDQPRVRLYDVFLKNTDPRLVYLEMDIYWAYVGAYRYPGFDPARYVLANKGRYPLFHIKDGDTNPENANGYDIVEFGAGDLPFADFLRKVNQSGKPYKPIWEQDTAPSTLPNPPGSFGAAERSFQAMANLRG
ncbi:xylose isomerase [Parafrankia colletiae]|uniref:Xylose isomerase n=1 Tax=Parafrankia colletiae TaxID=573497 RepID=A0A1S1Q7C2_9ACTN|nr:sugar phosphate isomerase/epimerase [Parafrankia colletiae]MCK9902982.1 sugar phosphate isomerase/epimerase [Frankia sp. Cpl3]OHV29085.1 xylose isomerase [Parafrankia colletiae]